VVSQVSAAPIEIRFEGTLTHVHPSLQVFVGVGAPLVIDIRWDTDTPDQCGDPRSGLYALGGATMAVGGAMLEGGGVIESDFPMNCRALGRNAVDFRLWWESPTGGPAFLHGPPFPPLGQALSVFLGGGTVNGYPALRPGGMPGPLPMEGLPARFGSFAMSAEGQLTSVPEPGSWMLLATGLVWSGLLWSSRRWSGR
jgi:hypothetical protein